MVESNIKQLIGKFTIYQYMIVFLIVLSLVSVFFYDFGAKALIQVLISVLTTTGLDFVISYFKFKSFEFPHSAFISGLFIGGLLTQNLEWYIYVIAGIIAILSKHLIRFQQQHIFNPANFGVLVVFLIFNAPNSWWISSPLYLVVLFGIFIVWKQRRFDLAVSFVAAYYILHAFVPQPVIMGNMRMMMGNFYQSFISQSTVFFFAMYMLIEPKTHPKARTQRVLYGFFTAVVLVGVEIYSPRLGIPLALAIGNILVPILNKLKVEFMK